MKDRVNSGYAWYVVGVLSLAYMIAYLDRLSLTLLIPMLKTDLGLSDTQVSMIQGFAFAIFFAVAGLPLGRIADRWSRRNLLIVGLLVWSMMTMLCGMATSFWELFAARIGVGVGEAALAPAAYSLVTDCFSAEKRGRAAGVMGAGTPIGSALSSAGAGLLLSLVPVAVMLPMVGLAAPWQIVFFAAGAPGLLVALLLLTVREPPRHDRAKDVGLPALGFAKVVLRNRDLFLPLYGALAFHFLATYGFMSWASVLLMRVHHMPLQTVGYLMGLMYLTVSVLGYLIGGVVSDMLVRRWPHDGRLRLLWGCYPPLILTFVALILSDSGETTFAIYVVFTFLVSVFGGTSYNLISETVTNENRGQAIALYVLTANLVGLGLSPTLVALITDYVFHDDMMLGRSIVAVCLPASVIVLLLLSRVFGSYARLRSEVSGEPIAPGRTVASAMPAVQRG